MRPLLGRALGSSPVTPWLPLSFLQGVLFFRTLLLLLPSWPQHKKEGSLKGGEKPRPPVLIMSLISGTVQMIWHLLTLSLSRFPTHILGDQLVLFQWSYSKKYGVAKVVFLGPFHQLHVLWTGKMRLSCSVGKTTLCSLPLL